MTLRSFCCSDASCVFEMAFARWYQNLKGTWLTFRDGNSVQAMSTSTIEAWLQSRSDAIMGRYASPISQNNRHNPRPSSSSSVDLARSSRGARAMMRGATNPMRGAQRGSRQSNLLKLSTTTSVATSKSEGWSRASKAPANKGDDASFSAGMSQKLIHALRHSKAATVRRSAPLGDEALAVEDAHPTRDVRTSSTPADASLRYLLKCSLRDKGTLNCFEKHCSGRAASSSTATARVRHALSTSASLPCKEFWT
mmetsp:Transcript_12954/g.34417  ORF Transcript_12954/g.34417 Transcript_12954/m.34417 type:complete len:253 (-) Transcript_12954:2-760(-)